MRCDAVIAAALAAMAVIAAVVAGCTQGICSRNSECAAGFVCTIRGKCEIAIDAGAAGSATPIDAGTDSPVNGIDAPATDAFDPGEDDQ